MDRHYPAPIRSAFGRLERLDPWTQRDDENVNVLLLHFYACCSLQRRRASNFYGLVAINLRNTFASRVRLEEARLLS